MTKLKKVKAFTLPELLVVLIIIGILVLLALPSLMPIISKAKSSEAMLHLKQIHTLQQTHFYLHSKYSKNLEEIGYETLKTVLEEGSANYRYEISEATESGFKARATAVVDFDKDGIYNLWEVDQHNKLVELVKD